MMKIKAMTVLGILLVILVLVFIIRFVIGGPEDNWICTESGWVKHGNPSSQMPGSSCNPVK